MRRVRSTVVAPVLLTAVLAFAVHALVPATSPAYDSLTYTGIASGLLGYHDPFVPFANAAWAIDGLAVRGYLYPLFVAGVYAAARGVHPEIAVWVQALVFLPLTTLLIYLAGREAFSRRVGLVAAWLFALWLPAVWHSVWLMTETMLNFLMALLLALGAGALARDSRKLALAAGLIAGLLSISHSAYQFVWLVLATALVTYFWIAARDRIAIAGFYAAGATVVILSYAVFTLAADLPRLGQGSQGVAGGGGWTFYVSSRWETGFQQISPNDLETSDLQPGDLVELGRKIDAGEVYVEDDLLAVIRRKLAKPDPYNETLTDGDYYRAGIANLLERPSMWPERLRRNASTLFILPSHLQLYAPNPVPETTWFRPIWRPLSALLAVLSTAGLLYVLRRRRDRLVLFVPALFQAALLILVAPVEARYVIATWSSMFLLAGVALVAVAQWKVPGGKPRVR